MKQHIPYCYTKILNSKRQPQAHKRKTEILFENHVTQNLRNAFIDISFKINLISSKYHFLTLALESPNFPI